MTKYFTLLLLLASLLFAETTNTASIDAQIQKIKNADASQRVKLMNAFKLRVAKMNQKERMSAIKAIQKNISTNVTTKNNNISQHMQTLQIQANESSMSYQNMNQQHIQGQLSPKAIEDGMNGMNDNFHPRMPH